jgi:predicted ATPase with chaperone activity
MLTPISLSDEVNEPKISFPRRPRTIEETGLTMSYIADLVVRALYVIGELTGQELSDHLTLSYEGVLDQAIRYLRKEQFAEVKGSEGISERSYRYQVTQKGVERAKELSERTQYLGPAPVPLETYTEMIRQQSIRGITIDEQALREAFAHLVLSSSLIQQVGPAVNSGRSLFLYGDAGNGKTSIAEAVARLFSETIFMPHAVIVDGQIIKVFDIIHHKEVPLPASENALADQRWVHTRRPIVMTGGELNMDSLDLIYNPISKYYEAPLQMKANGGLFFIDDFGRQQMRPQDLLNRWIVPLEKRVDFLTLHTGKKIEIPFDQLIIFSTNLDPKDLVDEAFLRRIRYKVEVGNPTPTQYREIMRRVCKDKGIPYSDEGLKYLLTEQYARRGIELRSVHPRDLMDQLVDTARFLNVRPTMSHELLDAACRSYFVEL